MTTTTTAILVWAAFALGAIASYKITDSRWRRRVKRVQDSLGSATSAHGIPLREGAIRKGGQNEPSNTPRPATPQASRPKTITSQLRGHPIYWDERRKAWFYADNQSPATVERPCAKCHKMPTPEGYDACLGHIPGATAACCGHGVEAGYVLPDSRQPRIGERLDVKV